MNKELLAEIENFFLKNCRIDDIGFDICIYPDKYKNYVNSEKIITAFEKSNKKKPEYTDDDFESFKEVYSNTNNIELKASLGYIIGHNKYKFRENHQLVKDTIEYLFSISDNLCASQKLDNDYHKMSEYISQAIELSKLFGKEENSIYEKKINCIKCEILFIYKNLPLSALELMEILFNEGGEKHFFTDKENDISEDVFDKIIDEIKNLSEEFLKSSYTFVYGAIEKVYCLKKKIYDKKGEREKAKECHQKLAEFLKEYAQRNESIDPSYNEITDNYVRVEIFEKAHKYYEEIGDKKNKNNVKVKIDKLHQESLNFFVRQEHSVNIEEWVNCCKEELKDKNLIESLVYLGFLFENFLSQQFSIEKIEEETIKTNTEYLGSQFFPEEKVDNKGNTIISLSSLNWQNPKEDIELLLQYKYKYIYEILNTKGRLLNIPLNLIKEKFTNIKPDDLDLLINNNKFIPEDRKEIFKRGIIYGFKGQWLEFLSLMCPQIENFYREIIVFCGGTDNKYKQNYTQQEYFTLGSILDNETLNEYYEENIILILKAILNEKAGANLRNRVAHGLINDDEANSGISIWLLFFVIMLCYLYNPVAHKIFDKLGSK